MKQSKPTSKNKKAANATAETKKPVVASKKSSIYSWLAGLYAAQAVAILLIATAKNLPVTGTYPTKDALASALTGHEVFAVAVRHLFEVNLAHIVGLFLLVAAIAQLGAHFYVNQKAEVAKGASKLRWAEYSLVASLIMVALYLLSGLGSISALLLVVGLSWVAGLSGLALQTYGTGRSRADWLVILVGAIGGITPWVVLAVTVWQALTYGGHIPLYVYFLYLTAFLYLKGTILITFLQYKGRGRFADKQYANKAYLFVSFVTLTALAWQIFAGALRP